MAHIVPLDRTRQQPTARQKPSKRDPFDVVVFLNHFLESDTYPDGLISQLGASAVAKSATARSPQKRPLHQLVMQTSQNRLALSLGRG
jgi:hypothetical protein